MSFRRSLPLIAAEFNLRNATDIFSSQYYIGFDTSCERFYYFNHISLGDFILWFFAFRHIIE
jgi:hypothetical protein